MSTPAQSQIESSYLELSQEQRIILKYAAKIPAVISMMTSTCVAFLIFKDKERLSKMYHRLALGMSICGVINSCVIFVSSWTIPCGTPGSVDAKGSILTCTITGFLIQAGFAVQYYYVSLALYVFLALKCEFRIQEIQFLEKYIHFFSVFIPTASAIYLVSAEMFNPIGMSCWIQSVPEGCDREGHGPCVRGAQNPSFYVLTFGALPTALNLIVSTSLIIACYINESRKQKNTTKSIVGKKILIEQARRKKSLLIARQGALYLATFYGSYLIPTIAAITQVITQRYIFPTLLMGTLFMPLDGFFFTLAYLKLRRFNSAKRKTNTINKEKIFDEFESEPNTNKIINRKSWCLANTSQRQTNQSLPVRRSSFSVSLFDGTDEEKWKNFGVYVGSDSDSDSDADDDAIINAVCALNSSISPTPNEIDNRA